MFFVKQNRLKRVISLIGILLCFTAVFSAGTELMNGLIISKWLWLAFISVPVGIVTVIFLIIKPVKPVFGITDIFVLILSGLIFVQGNLTGLFLLQFLSVIIAWIFIRVMFTEKKQSEQIILIYLLFVGIQCVYGLLQLYGILPSHYSQFLITGFFHNPGPFSGYIVSGLPISLGLFLHTRHKKQIVADEKQTNQINETPLLKRSLFNLSLKLPDENTVIYYFSIIMLVLLLLVLPSTRSRAAWLGGITGCVFVLLSYYNKTTLNHWFQSKLRSCSLLQKTLLYLAGLIIVFLSLAGLYKFKQGSADGRLLMWQISWNMIKDRPVTGWGSGGFQAQYGNYQANWFRNGNGTPAQELVAGMPESPFNEPLRIAVAYGFIGLLLFLCLVCCLFFNSGSTDLKLQLLKSGLISILVFSLFSYPLDTAPIVLQFVVLSALITNIKIINKQSPVVQKKVCNPVLIRILVVLVILIIMPALSKATWKTYKGHKHWGKAYQLYQQKCYSDAAEEYQNSVNYLPDDGLLLQMYGKCLTINGNWFKANQILEKASALRSDPILYSALGDSYKALKEYKKAEDAYRQSWYMEPGKFYPKYLLAKLYDENGQKKKAANIAFELINKKVKVESVAIIKIKKEMQDILDRGL